MSDFAWCLGGAYFWAKFEAGGAYRAGAYKKKSVYHVSINFFKSFYSI